MSNKLLRSIAGLLILGSLILILGGTMKGKPASAAQEKIAQDLWKRVEKAENDGLPQTAVDILKQIAALSREQKRLGEFLRALTRQIILESVIQGNKPEFRVNRLKEEIDKAPAELKPMMKLVLAQWYWQYYSRNKWRFMNRTATEGLNEKDFTTWDLPKIFKEIDSLYRDILKDEAQLKKIPLSAFSDFLTPGNMPAPLRPTLFDFAAFEALDFYTSAEQSAARPEDAFEIPADSPALGPVGEFLKYKPETTDVDSPKLRALQLFQELLAFHVDDKDKDVFLDADLQRLRYVKNAAVGEGLSARYLERLKELADDAGASSLQSLALDYWAQELYDLNDYVQAYDIAGRGEKAHPDSVGASNCHVLRARITAREFDLRAESVLRPGVPSKMVVSYRNITALNFRVFREDFSALLAGRDGENLFWMSGDLIRLLSARKPEAQWPANLKATADYKTATALVDVPALKPGFYRILASCNKDFSPDQNKIQAASFWVSDLGLITAGQEGAVRGYAVRGLTGEPVPSATVDYYQWDYNLKTLIKNQSVTTDDLGAFAFGPSGSYSNRLIYVRDGKGAELAEADGSYSYPHREEPETKTVFFTDRAIYRPGQMIFFKGLCLSVDRDQNSYRLLTGLQVRVSFRDVNQQEIAALDLVTNDFGSLSGTFNAPTDRLTGAMTIGTASPRGACTVRVEEYKRPKFQVKLEVPDKEFRLNDTVAVPGEAMAYTGAPVDGAQVKYRVVREVRYPWWWYYWYGRSSEGSQEIAHGTLKTDEAGKFSIEFKAKPDASVPAASGATFSYSLTADVTDSAGETRSADGFVRIGYASLEAGMSCADWQEQGKPVSVEVTTTTLNAKKIGAKGVVEIYRLKGPEKPVPADLIGEVDVREKEARGSDRTTGFSATSDWRKWPEGPLSSKKEFETNAKEDSRCLLSFDLPKGVYRAKLATKDKYGTAVESLLDFMVLDPAAKKFPVEVPFYSAVRNSSVEVGQTFEGLWATGYDQSPALVEVLQNNQWLQRFWTLPGQTQGTIKIPVEEKLRGGFTVIVSLVKENRLYRNETRVSVPWSNKLLELKWQSFRSKLRPGQKETWSVKVKGLDAEARAAEMVAGLYDASLDQFVGHGFPGLYGIFRSDWTYFQTSFSDRREDFRTHVDGLNADLSMTSLVYTHFPQDIMEDAWGYRYPGSVKYASARKAEAMPMAAPPSAPAEQAVSDSKKEKEAGVLGGVVGGVLGGVVGETGKPAAKKPPEPDLSKVQARTNLNETAFFFPQLLTDKDGVVTI